MKYVNGLFAVLEQRAEYPTLWAAIKSKVPKIGCVLKTLDECVCKHHIESAQRDDGTISERVRLKELGQEAKE